MSAIVLTRVQDWEKKITVIEVHISRIYTISEFVKYKAFK